MYGIPKFICDYTYKIPKFSLSILYGIPKFGGVEGVTLYALLAVCRPFRALLNCNDETGVASLSVICQSFGLTDNSDDVCKGGFAIFNLVFLSPAG